MRLNNNAWCFEVTQPSYWKISRQDKLYVTAFSKKSFQASYITAGGCTRRTINKDASVDRVGISIIGIGWPRRWLLLDRFKIRTKLQRLEVFSYWRLVLTLTENKRSFEIHAVRVIVSTVGQILSNETTGQARKWECCICSVKALVTSLLLMEFTKTLLQYIYCNSFFESVFCFALYHCNHEVVNTTSAKKFDKMRKHLAG